jgi:hypothetical protein
MWSVDWEYPLSPTTHVTPAEDLPIPSMNDFHFIAKKRLARGTSLIVLTD